MAANDASSRIQALADWDREKFILTIIDLNADLRDIMKITQDDQVKKAVCVAMAKLEAEVRELIFAFKLLNNQK